MTQGNWALAAAGVVGFFLSTSAQAIDLRPDAVGFQGGPGKSGVTVVSAGLAWDWDTRVMRAALVTGQTELILSNWHAHAIGGGDQNLQQLALVPILRMEPDHGRSPWVVELGIGVSWLSRQYETPNKQFGSTWNFYDVMGAGYRFGVNRAHEVGIRFTHVSNAGLKSPNPGEDFLLLRYSQRF